MINERNIPPGLIARLYQMRWDIEKSYDEIKNKLHEKKAWASSPTAKAMQAQLICLTHHLMVLQEHYFYIRAPWHDVVAKLRESYRVF